MDVQLMYNLMIWKNNKKNASDELHDSPMPENWCYVLWLQFVIYADTECISPIILDFISVSRTTSTDSSCVDYNASALFMMLESDSAFTVQRVGHKVWIPGLLLEAILSLTFLKMFSLLVEY